MLVDFLRANADIFAWSPSDMPGIPREVAEHSLDIRPNSKPVKQRLRRFNELKRRAIGEELQKLLAAGFIKEMKESDQLATSFITPIRHVLLHYNALWPQKRRSYISAVYAPHFRRPSRAERRGICR